MIVREHEMLMGIACRVSLRLYFSHQATWWEPHEHADTFGLRVRA